MTPTMIAIAKEQQVKLFNHQELNINSINPYFLDLAEVQSVGQAVTPFQITGSKKIDEKAFFDVSRELFSVCVQM